MKNCQLRNRPYRSALFVSTFDPMRLRNDYPRSGTLRRGSWNADSLDSLALVALWNLVVHQRPLERRPAGWAWFVPQGRV